MRTKAEIKEKIEQIKLTHSHALHGKIATVQANAPLALVQVATETRLHVLHWVLGTEYKSQLKR